MKLHRGSAGRYIPLRFSILAGAALLCVQLMYGANAGKSRGSSCKYFYDPDHQLHPWVGHLFGLPAEVVGFLHRAGSRRISQHLNRLPTRIWVAL
jgi:hypothetical protein